MLATLAGPSGAILTQSERMLSHLGKSAAGAAGLAISETAAD